jgi:hypothetical protein
VQLKYLGGIVVAESELDPGAVGYDTPDDKGLVQINLPAHPEFTYDQAFDHTVHDPVGGERAAHHARRLRLDQQGRPLAGRDPVAQQPDERGEALAKTGEYPTDQAKSTCSRFSLLGERRAGLGTDANRGRPTPPLDQGAGAIGNLPQGGEG